MATPESTDPPAPDASAAKSTNAQPASIVLASFKNRRASERMVWSLGRKFREKARKGKAAALVITGNKDGTLEITQSRVLTESALLGVLIRFAVAVLVGLSGILSLIQGAKDVEQADRDRKRLGGSDEQEAHEILAQAGPNAALSLIRCNDAETEQTVVSAAKESAAGYYWHGPLTEFLASLDPSGKHDPVRTVLGEPSPKR